MFAEWDALAAMNPDPALGLPIGAEGATEHYDIASIAALHSPNFGEALQRCRRFERLTCPEVIRIERGDGEVRVRFHWFLVEGHSPQLLTDGTFASVLELARRGTGTRVVPRRVELVRAHERAGRDAGRAFRLRAALRRRGRRHRVRRGAARAALRHPQPRTCSRCCCPAWRRALAAQTPAASLLDQARAVLGRTLRGERPSIQTVAAELCVSTRTLQRRLEEAGTSYQRLLDEVRHQAARQLLEDTQLEAGEIAFVLGFEELNSFTRAFRGWEDHARAVAHGAGACILRKVARTRARSRPAASPRPPQAPDAGRQLEQPLDLAVESSSAGSSCAINSEICSIASAGEAQPFLAISIAVAITSVFFMGMRTQRPRGRIRRSVSGVDRCGIRRGAFAPPCPGVSIAGSVSRSAASVTRPSRSCCTSRRRARCHSVSAAAPAKCIRPAGPRCCRASGRASPRRRWRAGAPARAAASARRWRAPTGRRA